MSIENLIQSIENQILALEEKKKVAIGKGRSDLLMLFDNQLVDLQVQLALIKKGIGEGIQDNEKIKTKIDEFIQEYSDYTARKSEELKKDLEDYKNQINTDLESFEVSVKKKADESVEELRSYFNKAVEDLKSQYFDQHKLYSNSSQTASYLFNEKLEDLNKSILQKFNDLESKSEQNIIDFEQKHSEHLLKLENLLTLYTQGGRFKRAWKILIGRL